MVMRVKAGGGAHLCKKNSNALAADGPRQDMAIFVVVISINPWGAASDKERQQPFCVI